MKKIIALVIFVVSMGISAQAQNGITSMVIHRDANGSTANTMINIGGPDAQDVASVSVQYRVPNSMIEIPDLSLNGSNGSNWTGSISLNGVNATSLNEGIIRIYKRAGEVQDYGFMFQLGTGTRTTATQASSKAELL